LPRPRESALSEQNPEPQPDPGTVNPTVSEKRQVRDVHREPKPDPEPDHEGLSSQDIQAKPKRLPIVGLPFGPLRRRKR